MIRFNKDIIPKLVNRWNVNQVNEPVRSLSQDVGLVYDIGRDDVRYAAIWDYHTGVTALSVNSYLAQKTNFGQVGILNLDKIKWIVFDEVAYKLINNDSVQHHLFIHLDVAFQINNSGPASAFPLMNNTIEITVAAGAETDNAAQLDQYGGAFYPDIVASPPYGAPVTWNYLHWYNLMNEAIGTGSWDFQIVTFCRYALKDETITQNNDFLLNGKNN